MNHVLGFLQWDFPFTVFNVCVNSTGGLSFCVICEGQIRKLKSIIYIRSWQSMLWGPLRVSEIPSGAYKVK